MLRAAMLLSLAVLAGSALGPQTRAGVVSYDFGLPRAQHSPAARLHQDLIVAEVSAPAWMDNSRMYYRLAY